MTILKLTAKKAIKNFGSNIYSRWHKAGVDVNDGEGNYAVQRMKKSIFTPRINIKDIKVSVEDNVFTIGSCFARGIEKSLLARNESVYNSVTALGATNKYNTYSILNEIQWALDPEYPFPEKLECCV